MQHQPTSSNRTFIQGVLFLIGGILLLLYIFNMIPTGINFILVLVALALIMYGGMLSGLNDVLHRLYEKATSRRK